MFRGRDERLFPATARPGGTGGRTGAAGRPDRDGGTEREDSDVQLEVSRVSDHRLGHNFPLQGFLGGEVGPIIDGLIARDQETKLRQLSEEVAS